MAHTAPTSSICSSVLEALGNTPLVHLARMGTDGQARVLAKLEALNPGGSIKSRTAMAMVTAAEEAGLLHPDSIIVEATSGNQGIGLAMVAAVKGYRARLIMPDCASDERCKLIWAYGADCGLINRVIVVSDYHARRSTPVLSNIAPQPGRIGRNRANPALLHCWKAVALAQPAG
ncbi:MAG: pyridoxal-phosphate dependent enzyme [Bacillota bacterium]|nr:pyridoxal-phosphate dependent enzyme [Bacillota bacterium]